MAEECRLCGVNQAENGDGTCALCAGSPDPYADAASRRDGGPRVTPQPRDVDFSPVKRTGGKRAILIHGGTEGKDQDQDTDLAAGTSKIPVYGPGQTVQPDSWKVAGKKNVVGGGAGAAPAPTYLCAGISRNISASEEERGFLSKWFRALFQGVPFATAKEVTSFQVYPGFSGATNAMGNACDQVVIFGRLPPGAICENNQVEIYGRRDANNVIIAQAIKNVASGTMIRPEGTLSPVVAWLVTLAVLAFILVAGSVAAQFLLLAVQSVVPLLMFAAAIFVALKLLGVFRRRR